MAQKWITSLYLLIPLEILANVAFTHVQWFSFVAWSTSSVVASLTKTGKPSHVRLKIAASLHDSVQFGWAWMLKMVHETWKFSRVSSDTFLSRSWLSVFLIGRVPTSTETSPSSSISGLLCLLMLTCSAGHVFKQTYRRLHRWLELFFLMSNGMSPLPAWGDFLNGAITHFFYSSYIQFGSTLLYYYYIYK